MSRERHHVERCLSGVFLLGLCLLLLMPVAALPRLAEAQGTPGNVPPIQAFTLREFSVIPRDGSWVLYQLPGSPFPFNSLGASFSVGSVCSPPNVFLSAGQGFGDLVAFTAGWPFGPQQFIGQLNLCDPNADATAWFAYGNSLNNSPLLVGRFFGNDDQIQLPSCTTLPVATEGMYFVGLRSRNRQVSDLSCQNRDPSFPIRVGNVLICSLTGPWLNPDGTARLPHVVRRCQFYITCSNQLVGSDLPRGVCGSFAGAPVTFVVPTGGTGSVTVTVNNAANGNPIAGATVYDGELSQPTAANGTTTFTVPAGAPITFTASAQGFVPEERTTTVGANGSTDLTISLSPPVAGARIVLNWGGEPRDLDSHLTGPAAGGGRFHVFFGNRNAPGVSLFPDDTDGMGPETITVTQVLPGLYRYSVHHFAGNGTICSMASQISVSVVVGAEQALTFQPPSSGCVGASGNVWVVFEFNGVSVNPINLFYSSSAGGVVGPAVAGHVNEDMTLLRALPPK